MAMRDFLKKHGIVRNSIKKDLLHFAVPWILVLISGMSMCALDLVKQQGNLQIQSVQNIIGIILFVLGFTIIITAHFTLWRLYSSTLVIKENHQLITHGIYHYIRHPIYFGTIICFFGIALFASSLYGALILAVQIPVFLNRIRIEEKLLIEEFGDAYRKYKETTSKLVPFIY